MQTVIEVCRFKDFEFGADQIKRWERTFREHQDQCPDAFANQFIEGAEQIERAIQAGDERVKERFDKLDAGERVLAWISTARN